MTALKDGYSEKNIEVTEIETEPPSVRNTFAMFGKQCIPNEISKDRESGQKTSSKEAVTSIVDHKDMNNNTIEHEFIPQKETKSTTITENIDSSTASKTFQPAIRSDIESVISSGKRDIYTDGEANVKSMRDEHSSINSMKDHGLSCSQKLPIEVKMNPDRSITRTILTSDIKNNRLPMVSDSRDDVIMKDAYSNVNAKSHIQFEDNSTTLPEGLSQNTQAEKHIAGVDTEINNVGSENISPLSFQDTLPYDTDHSRSSSRISSFSLGIEPVDELEISSLTKVETIDSLPATQFCKPLTPLETKIPDHICDWVIEHRTKADHPKYGVGIETKLNDDLIQTKQSIENLVSPKTETNDEDYIQSSSSGKPFQYLVQQKNINKPIKKTNVIKSNQYSSKTLSHKKPKCKCQYCNKWMPSECILKHEGLCIMRPDHSSETIVYNDLILLDTMSDDSEIKTSYQETTENKGIPVSKSADTQLSLNVTPGITDTMPYRSRASATATLEPQIESTCEKNPDPPTASPDMEKPADFKHAHLEYDNDISEQKNECQHYSEALSSPYGSKIVHAIAEVEKNNRTISTSIDEPDLKHVNNIHGSLTGNIQQKTMKEKWKASFKDLKKKSYTSKGIKTVKATEDKSSISREVSCNYCRKKYAKSIIQRHEGYCRNAAKTYSFKFSKRSQLSEAKYKRMSSYTLFEQRLKQTSTTRSRKFNVQNQDKAMKKYEDVVAQSHFMETSHGDPTQQSIEMKGHAEIDTTKKTVNKCWKCRRKFSALAGLKIHLKCGTCTESKKCENLQIDSNTKGDARVTKANTVSSEKQCSRCQKKFCSISNAKRHMRNRSCDKQKSKLTLKLLSGETCQILTDDEITSMCQNEEDPGNENLGVAAKQEGNTHSTPMQSLINDTEHTEHDEVADQPAVSTLLEPDSGEKKWRSSQLNRKQRHNDSSRRLESNVPEHKEHRYEQCVDVGCTAYTNESTSISGQLPASSSVSEESESDVIPLQTLSQRLRKSTNKGRRISVDEAIAQSCEQCTTDGTAQDAADTPEVPLVKRLRKRTNSASKSTTQ
ncbi:unnamed protein product [Owenia fusiformis]|uniref:C2H2-type domain-containing protein n=1 Tax=Owenia fusiformis TaxID=6347 RepID=A0A8S4MY07_OWEFU|nr:unnamed protein product [Owenia fusiformis]